MMTSMERVSPKARMEAKTPADEVDEEEEERPPEREDPETAPLPLPPLPPRARPSIDLQLGKGH